MQTSVSPQAFCMQPYAVSSGLHFKTIGRNGSQFFTEDNLTELRLTFPQFTPLIDTLKHNMDPGTHLALDYCYKVWYLGETPSVHRDLLRRAFQLLSRNRSFTDSLNG